MLSRPHQAQATSADKAQIAALFGMMGLFAGVVVVAALAWLYALTQQMNDQTATLTKLEKSVDQTDRVQVLALETLLAKTDEGRDPRKFVENYQKAQRELEAAKEAVKDKEKLTLLAVADNKRLESELEKVKKDKDEVLEKAKGDKESYEAEREKARDLKSELDAVFKTPQGELSKKYSLTLYAAIAGWIAALLASLGLLAMWLSRTPLEDDTIPRPGSITVPVPGLSPSRPPSEEPPHQIN
jgi:hypothetical protein